ncbi:MAG TPA: hypothetical protein PLP66_14965, partial [Phycisphaerae bacterium]|nr:hypothetical protein [Phycisphaerae bacterium]
IFVSLMIDFNTSGNDTTVNDATRMKLDSTVTHCNLIRGHMIRSHTISGTGADTTVGNTYRQEQRLWLFPRY